MPGLPRLANSVQLVLLIVGLTAGLVGVSSLSDTRDDTQVARELAATGVRLIVTDVEVAISGVGRGKSFDGAWVRFTAGGVPVQAKLRAATEDSAGKTGRHPPRRESGYAPPLEISYRASEPTVAMAVEDIDYLASGNAIRDLWILMLAGSGMVLLVVGLAVLRNSRAGWPWWQFVEPSRPRHARP